MKDRGLNDLRAVDRNVRRSFALSAYESARSTSFYVKPY
jgi:hypothetical protein